MGRRISLLPYFNAKKWSLNMRLNRNIDKETINILLQENKRLIREKLDELQQYKDALKKGDIQGNIIHISKTETIYQDESGKTHYDVKNFPKTEAGVRDVIVPDNCKWILKRINRLCPFGEYIFMQNNERIRSYIFRTRLYSNCKKLDIVVKSPYKVRKTYGSKLYDAGTITRRMLETLIYQVCSIFYF